MIGAATGVIKDVPPGKVWSGYYGMDHMQNTKAMAALKRLPQLVQQMKKFMKKQEEKS